MWVELSGRQFQNVSNHRKGALILKGSVRFVFCLASSLLTSLANSKAYSLPECGPLLIFALSKNRNQPDI